MTTQNATDLEVSNNADGFDIAGGTTKRKITVSGADVSIVGAGTAEITFPSSTGTLSTLDGTETLTNKTLTSPKVNEDVALTTTATKLNYLTSATGTTGTTSTNIVFSTSPTLVTPALGTPSSGNLANCTFPTLNQNTTGTAAKATILETARAINGVDFNGSAPITISILPINSAPADHSYSGITVTLTAGETITSGQVCYLKSDGKMWLAKADAVLTSGSCLLGLATGAITAESSGVFLLKGYFQDAVVFTMTPCVPQFVSVTTGGAITETAPSSATNIVRIVGYSQTPDIIYFSPDNTWLEI